MFRQKNCPLIMIAYGTFPIMVFITQKEKQEKKESLFMQVPNQKGESLNRHLLQGRDLTNSLRGVLHQFRKEPEAFICDIEGIFHRVNINYEHRNLLSFLWWEQGNIEWSLVEYRMTVHLFWAVSSSGCTNFVLKTTADDFEGECGNDAGDFVRDDYVDDGLKSVPSIEQAINLMENTKTLCKKGGFNLHKLFQIEEK